MFTYEIIHCIFSFLWTFHFFNMKWLWWLLWMPIVFFIVILIFNESLNTYINQITKKPPFRLINALWFIAVILSAIWNNPW